MISQIRLRAHGPSIEGVDAELRATAARIDPNALIGETVVQREMAESLGSDFAFAGRMLIYPDISKGGLRETG